MIGTIDYIDNPSEEVQLAAVNQNGYAIYYIKNPSEAVKLAAKNKTIIKDSKDKGNQMDKETEEKNLAAVILST